MSELTFPLNDRLSGPYTASDSQTEFAYDFPIKNDDELEVWHYDVGAGTITKLTLTTHYTVQDAGEQAGGTITLVSGATENDVYAIYGALDEERTSDYATAGSFTATAANADFDAAIVMIQEARRDLDRALQLQKTDTDGSGAYDANSNRITGLADGTEDSDAVTKSQMDELDAAADAAAAAASATAAASSASAAAASATSAASAAAALMATSTSSVAIGTGSKTFTVQADKQFTAGLPVFIGSDADPATDFMFGKVTSYSGTTLIVNVTDTGGSGTHADWTIMPSGIKGATGATGPAGPATVPTNTVTVMDSAGGDPSAGDYAAGQTIDGHTLAEGETVLRATSGGNASDGVYDVPASGAASRNADFDTYDEHPGKLIAVQEGTAHADKIMLCTSDTGGTLDSTAITFEQRYGSGTESTEGLGRVATDAEAGGTTEDFAWMTPHKSKEQHPVKSQTWELSGLIVTPSDQDYKIKVKLGYAFTITETTTISASGTCTATFKINTTALGGTANSVSSSEQSQAHASDNEAGAGDDLVITVSANSSCDRMSFTIKGTRSLD